MAILGGNKPTRLGSRFPGRKVFNCRVGCCRCFCQMNQAGIAPARLCNGSRNRVLRPSRVSLSTPLIHAWLASAEYHASSVHDLSLASGQARVERASRVMIPGPDIHRSVYRFATDQCVYGQPGGSVSKSPPGSGEVPASRFVMLSSSEACNRPTDATVVRSAVQPFPQGKCPPREAHQKPVSRGSR